MKHVERGITVLSRIFNPSIFFANEIPEMTFRLFKHLEFIFKRNERKFKKKTRR